MQASLKHKAHGQSIPLIAAMLVVLFGMVALAVDVGQTYAEQRNIVRGTNAASLAGMNRYLTGGTDADVRKAIEQSLLANGVRVTPYGAAPQPGDRTVKAEYLDAAGSRIASCPEVGACGTQKVDGVKYIRVDVDGKVQMYFAQLFGTRELPVSSNAFSKLGFCTSGFYPIGVRSVVNGQSMVDDQGFIKHDGFYTDETYNDPPLKYRKLYMHGISNSNGGFSLLRWDKDKQGSGDKKDLADMMAGDGNINDSFTEVEPWPSITEGPAQYTGYPREPGIFSGNEWVYGSDFNSGNPPFTGPVLAQLEYHKKNRTVLTLPMYRYDNGDVDDPAYYVETLGAFLLLDYGQDSGGSFLTLAYLRPGGMCSSLETNPPPSDKLVLAGKVEYLPRYRVPNDSSRPIRFLVVLDVTGSMNWNFDGQGTINGTNVSCVDGQETCNKSPNTGPKAAWGNEKERRIYIAKQVLKNFVDELAAQSNVRPFDTMRIVTFAGDFGDLVNNEGIEGDNVAAVNDLTKVLPAQWSNSSAVLKDAIDNAGDIGQGPYLMDGATSSAAGLARATQVFDSLPTPDKAPDGQLYRNVVIFVTDGVANVLRNGMLNNYGNCAAETVACQAGIIEIGGQQIRAPLEAMVYEANNLTQEHVLPTGGQTYVVALGSNTDKTGLDAVATSGLAQKANEAGALSKIFEDLQQDAVYGPCKAAFASNPVNTMAASDVATGSPPAGFSQLTTSKVGEVYLTNNETGQQFTVPIVASEPGRALSYEARDLPRGTYTMKAWVGYRAPEDKVARSYDQFMVNNLPSSQIPVNVTTSAASLNGVVEKNISLDLSKQVCATEEPAAN
jgi:hypothetical protein